MILRIDALSWGLAAVLGLTAGIWRVYAARRGRSRWPIILAALALAVLAAGLIWRLWQTHLWPGASGADGLVLAAAGALACSLWQDWRTRRRAYIPGSHATAWILGIGQVAVGLLLAATMIAALRLAAQSPAASTGNWLLGLRNLMAGLGLGGWFFLAAGALYAGATTVWRIRPRHFAAVASAAAEPVAIFQPAPLSDPEHARPVVLDPGLAPATAGPAPAAVATAVTAPTSVPVSAPIVMAVGPAPALAPVVAHYDAARNTDFALRFSYPWLTAALALGCWWSITAYATPWRGRPAELWLAITWLIGGAFLHAVAGGRSLGLPRIWSYVLAMLGLLAALLAAWQMPGLLN